MTFGAVLPTLMHRSYFESNQSDSTSVLSIFTIFTILGTKILSAVQYLFQRQLVGGVFQSIEPFPPVFKGRPCHTSDPTPFHQVVALHNVPWPTP